MKTNLQARLLANLHALAELLDAHSLPHARFVKNAATLTENDLAAASRELATLDWWGGSRSVYDIDFGADRAAGGRKSRLLRAICIDFLQVAPTDVDHQIGVAWARARYGRSTSAHPAILDQS